MKKFKFLAMAACAVMMLGSCSDDKIDGPAAGTGTNIHDSEGGMYFTLDIQMPSARGDRSVTEDPNDGYSTSSSGVEVGQDYENSVAGALIVLADVNDNFISAARVGAGTNLVKGENETYTITSSFSKTDIAAYYAQANSVAQANIFVFCNPSQELIDAIYGVEGVGGAAQGSTDWRNTILSYTSIDAQPWIKNQFPMGNAVIATREIPKDLNGWNNYTSAEHAFDLSGYNQDTDINNGVTNTNANGGPIRVERMVARFDIRDGSVDGINDEKLNGVGNFTYDVLMARAIDPTISTEDNFCVLQVVLENAYLVNVNKYFYAIRRTSPTGFNNGTTLCGPEQPWSNGRTGN